ncbi:MAG: hypothetical protein NZM38_10290 [Cytophagales bacterium]|nr:hypothetical protein [Cytophagales bacterium]MDW8385142.1 hypothetical protein [Flammeovirgaceae bacterium]
MGVSLQHIEAQVKQFVEAIAASQEDLFCIEVSVKPFAKKLKVVVVVDCDGGITVERCAEISQILEKNIDNHNLIEESYELEVSSPGVGEPLKHPRQWKNVLHRKIEVRLLEGKKLVGVLTDYDDERIVIREEIEAKNPKNKQKQWIEGVEIQRSMIEQVIGLVNLK